MISMDKNTLPWSLIIVHWSRGFNLRHLESGRKRFKHFQFTESMRWIVADPEICHGKPIFKETRILVSDVLELLAAGESFEEILEEYPSLNKDMIKEALEYSAKIVRGEHCIRFEIPVG